jgi:hypothetical protein
MLDISSNTTEYEIGVDYAEIYGNSSLCRYVHQVVLLKNKLVVQTIRPVIDTGFNVILGGLCMQGEQASNR